MKLFKTISILCLAILFASVAYAFPITIDGVTSEYSGPEVKLMLNNNLFTPSQDQMPPVIIDDRTLVPVREVFEALNGTVAWDNNTRTVTVTMNGNTIILTINSTTALINNVSKELDVPAKIINDKTMVPVRFISENGGLEVNWEDTTKTVYITMPASEPVELSSSLPYAAQVFNDKMAKFFGDKKGKNTTYQICDVITTHNSSDSAHPVEIEFIDEKQNNTCSSDSVVIYEIKKNIIQYVLPTNYEISGSYDDEGYISRITIQRKK